MAILQVYLRVNKIWKRKHTKEVSDSQSIAGNSLLLLNCLIWIVYYLQNGDTKSIVDTSIIVFEAFVFLLISTGIFVKGREKIGFWRSIKEAFRFERSEANYLWNKWFKPDNAPEIIKILYFLANIDNEFDVREKKLIDKFASNWHLKTDFSNFNKEFSDDYKENIIYLKDLISEYLNSSPNDDQVAQLKDLINLMIHADEKITKEEQIIKDEIEPLLENYLTKQDPKGYYHVIIVPQKSEHEVMLKKSMPNAEIIHTSGGIAYSIGKFFSQSYAEVVCLEFRENFQMFTIVHLPESENN